MTLSHLPTWLHSIHHDGSQLYVAALTPRLGERVRLRLRVGEQAPVRRVYLRAFPDGEQALTPLTPSAHTPPCRWWETELEIREPLTHYRFVLAADDGVWHYNARGVSAHVPLDHGDFRIVADYEAPEWLATAVFYQIFPDRFANGDPANDPQPGAFSFRGHAAQTYPWGAPPPADQPFPLVFYGGDLAGIAQRLDYLEELGINALYLNPIFTAVSNHKYDVADYEQVDPHLGGDAALIALRRALDGRGMRYILDVVPNHCGYWHPWFQAARANPQAPEAEFFTFTRHPDEYASWLGVWLLPKLNYRSAELRRRIYAGEEALFRRWLRPPFSADGWRVDVANMLARQGPAQLGREVAQGIRQAVKATRPDAYLMGEHFFDATPLLQGDQWDGVMNYAGLAMPLWYWLDGYELGAHGLADKIVAPAPWPTQALADSWRSHLAAIPWAIGLQQYNVLGSHDTRRIHSVVGGNDALHKLAAVVQCTYPGVPGLYYGDEIGLSDDPHLAQRACMPWDESAWNRELRAFYRQLIRLRRETAVLQRGGFQMLAVEADALAYQRDGPGERAIVVAHRGAAPRPAAPLPVAHGGVPDGARFVEVFSGQALTVRDGALPLDAHPQGATIWLQR